MSVVPAMIRLGKGHYRTQDSRWEVRREVRVADTRDGAYRTVSFWMLRSNNREDARWLRYHRLSRQRFTSRQEAMLTLMAVLDTADDLPSPDPDQVQEMIQSMTPLRRDGKTWVAKDESVRFCPASFYSTTRLSGKSRASWRVDPQDPQLFEAMQSSGLHSRMFPRLKDAVRSAAEMRVRFQA